MSNLKKQQITSKFQNFYLSHSDFTTQFLQIVILALIKFQTSRFITHSVSFKEGLKFPRKKESVWN